MVSRPTDADCAEAAELIPAYVLDGLAPADAARIEAHVETCPRCREALDGYRVVAEGLLHTVPGVDARAVTEVDTATHPDDGHEAGPDSQAPAPDSARPAVGGQPAPRGLGWAVRLGQYLHEPERRWSLGAVTTTLVLVVVLLGSNLYWAVVTSALRSDRQELTTLAVGQLAALETAASGGRVVLLRGGETAPGAVGTITLDAEGAGGVLVVSDLPRQPVGKVYQLWLIDGGERESGGLFTADAEGRALLHIDSPEALSGYQTFTVTLEPEGGSPGPSGPAVLDSGA